MVQVKNLKKYYNIKKGGLFQEPGIVKAIDDISFSIPKGETLGLVGESGCGKTTTARSILRLIEPESGEIHISGTDINSLGKDELRKFRKNMQMVFQDPFSSLNPRMSVEKIITEPLRIHTDMTKADTETRLFELIELVGLQKDQMKRYPHEFSGGQRQRIGIARAIALNPEFIVLDEPVSALDVSIQGQIINLLIDLQEKLNLTYLFVAHDLAVVEHMSKNIIVMYLGKIVEESSAEELYSDPKHPYTKSLLKSIPDVRPQKHGFSILRGEIPSPENPPAGCHFHPRCPHAMDICRQEYPELKNIGDSRVACHLF